MILKDMLLENILYPIIWVWMGPKRCYYASIFNLSTIYDMFVTVNVFMFVNDGFLIGHIY